MKSKDKQNRDVDFERYINDCERESKKRFIVDNCCLCGKKTTSLCNSHDVPQFILEEIAENGAVSYAKAIGAEKVRKTTRGVRNANPFKLICKKCDNETFKAYESKDVIENFDILDATKKSDVLKAIAIKMHLSRIYAKGKEENLVHIVYPFVPKLKNVYSAREIDMMEHAHYIEELKKVKDTDFFEIIYSKTLNYKVQLACQAMICLLKDLKNKTVFDVHDFMNVDDIDYLYLCIFPYDASTKIIFFVEKKRIGHNRSFIDQFNKLNEEEKLHLLFVLLIVYTDQFYMSPSLFKIINADKEIVKLFYKSSYDYGRKRMFNYLSKYKKYNNYLLEKYQVDDNHKTSG